MSIGIIDYHHKNPKCYDESFFLVVLDDPKLGERLVTLL
jgi:hypothetical protein